MAGIPWGGGYRHGILTRSSKHESPTSLRTRETQSTRTALCFLPGVDLLIQAHDWHQLDG